MFDKQKRKYWPLTIQMCEISNVDVLSASAGDSSLDDYYGVDDFTPIGAQ